MRIFSICVMTFLAILAFCIISPDDEIIQGPAMKFMPAFLTLLVMSSIRLPRRWLRIACYATLWLDGSLVFLILRISDGHSWLAICAVAVASVWFFSDFFSNSLVSPKKL